MNLIIGQGLLPEEEKMRKYLNVREVWIGNILTKGKSRD